MWRVCAVVASVALVIAAFANGENGTAPTSQPTSRPALSATPADNSYCNTCHINMASEVLNTQHQRVGIGCTTCHGESDKHSSDENGLTPPDIMYPTAKIYSACVKCHETEKLEQQIAHDPMFNPRPRQQSCTECHGKHKTPVRTRRWDKATGKLLSDDGVRMVNDADIKK